MAREAHYPPPAPVDPSSPPVIDSHLCFVEEAEENLRAGGSTEESILGVTTVRP